MANPTSMLSTGQHDSCSADITNHCSYITVPNVGTICNDSKNLEDLQCFVCDAKIKGRRYALATCKTQTSRSRVIEKLGELVGERYMVVISEDDIICRSCANLINTLDRLEVEIHNVRDNVLRFLEQKYSLKEGELGNIEKQKRSQPPQITKCNNQIVANCPDKKGDTLSLEKTKSKKNNIWLQCDKCHYTALHNSFMAYHARDNIKQNIFCDKCGIQFFENQEHSHKCNLKEDLSDQNVIQESSLQNVRDTIMDIQDLEKTIGQNVPIVSIEPYTESHISCHNDSIPIIRLSNSENLSLQSILTRENNSTTRQPIYVRVLQPVEINEASAHSTMLTVTNSDTDITMKLKDNIGKPILTLTEDGSLEMAEVACWNDLHSPASQANITYP